jgi:hypothetical protein
MADDLPTADAAPSDPFDDELVAYLDGELDPAAARAVEDRLARDPAARDRAAELKKAFDLLDYLPKPEPSPTFTTRTLDKLPAVKSGPSPAALPAVPVAQGPARSGSAPVPTYTVSTSMPVPLDPPAARTSPLLWVAAVCAAVAACGVVGYVATAAARPYLFPVAAHRDKDTEPPAEVDARVAEHLPLYAVADDLAFVTELAKPELFGDDPAVSFDPALKGPSAEAADRPTAKEQEALVKAFRALPAARQADVVRLDRDLHAKEPRERERLFRALEAYAVWLDRLPDAERRGILAAVTPTLRLGAVRDLRDRQWLDALPPAVRSKPEQVQVWRDEEATRRDRLAFVRQHAEAFAVSRSPWPFDTDVGRKEVQDFARAVFKLGEPQNRRRLDGLEQTEYTRTLQVAQRDDAWAWYGLLVYELMHQRPYLPEPADPKLMYADTGDLPDAFGRFAKKALSIKLNAARGKWPEFPLQLHADIQNTKLGAVPALPQLGPTHYTEFKEPVRTFATKELFPKLTADERREMERAGGKWPDYSRRFVELARKYDLSVPGVTLPFSPKRWDATYGTRPAGREK